MENNEKNLEAIFAKLKKLQRLYDGAKAINSEGEANNAAAAIQRLMLQYNLSSAEVDAYNEPNPDVIEERRVSNFNYRSIGGTWESRLLNILCQFNFCKSFQVGGVSRGMIVGKKENIEMVLWLRDFLSRQFVELSKKRWKEYMQGFEYAFKPCSKDKFQRNYLIGCTDGLYLKLKEEADRDKEDLGEGITALVVRSNADIDKYMERYNVGTARRTRDDWSSARAQGQTDGRNVQINKPLTSGRSEAEKTRLLG